MKKLLPLILLALATPALADFTALIDAGKLRLDGANALPAGSVLILVAAGGDGSFSNSLAAGQLVSGNDILLSLVSVPLWIAAVTAAISSVPRVRPVAS